MATETLDRRRSRPKMLWAPNGRNSQNLANSQIQITYDDVGRNHYVLGYLVVSYSQAPAAGKGNIQVQFDGKVVIDLDIIAGGPQVIIPPTSENVIEGRAGEKLVITLAADTGGAIGKMAWSCKIVGPSEEDV